MRAKKLADGSVRDTKWQREEYERVMGREAAERQELAAREQARACICKRRTIRAKGEPRGTFRTVHERHCSKYKHWMEEYLPAVESKA